MCRLFFALCSLVMLCGCGATLRLDYTGKDGASIGGGVTFADGPDTPRRVDSAGNPNFGAR